MTSAINAYMLDLSVELHLILLALFLNILCVRCETLLHQISKENIEVLKRDSADFTH